MQVEFGEKYEVDIVILSTIEKLKPDVETKINNKKVQSPPKSNVTRDTWKSDHKVCPSQENKLKRQESPKILVRQ